MLNLIYFRAVEIDCALWFETTGVALGVARSAIADVRTILTLCDPFCTDSSTRIPRDVPRSHHTGTEHVIWFDPPSKGLR